MQVYKDNQAQLGSRTKIVFIGQSESAKAVIANISGENEFSKYGVYFGNLGNKAAIFTDKDVLIDNQKLYDEFIDSYMMFISNSDSDYIASQAVERQVVPSAIIKEKKAIASEKLSKGYEMIESGVSNASNLPAKVSEERQKGKLLKKISGKASKFAVAAVDAAVDAGENAAEMTKGIIKSNKEIPDQQCRCGVLAFYIQQLGEFMEG